MIVYNYSTISLKFPLIDSVFSITILRYFLHKSINFIWKLHKNYTLRTIPQVGPETNLHKFDKTVYRNCTLVKK